MIWLVHWIPHHDHCLAQFQFRETNAIDLSASTMRTMALMAFVIQPVVVVSSLWLLSTSFWYWKAFQRRLMSLLIMAAQNGHVPRMRSQSLSANACSDFGFHSASVVSIMPISMRTRLFMIFLKANA